MLFGSVFRLYTAGLRPGVAGDVATFYQLAEDFQVPGSWKVLDKNSPLQVFCELKDTAADSKVPASTADVRQSLKNNWAAVGEDIREEWADRTVFMLIDRRAGRLFSSSCATSAEIRSSDIGKQCVLLTNADFPGLLSESLYNVLCASEYIKSENVDDLSLFIEETEAAVFARSGGNDSTASGPG